MKCPNCSLINPPTGMICDCGYNFKTKTGGKPKGMKPETARGFLIASGILVLLGGVIWYLVFNPPGEGGSFSGAIFGAYFGIPVLVIAVIIGLIGLFNIDNPRR